jgi:hypothetical protein
LNLETAVDGVVSSDAGEAASSSMREACHAHFRRRPNANAIGRPSRHLHLHEGGPHFIGVSSYYIILIVERSKEGDQRIT